jgi:hypothetical protein
VSTSAYPLAFPEALAFWTIPPVCILRLTTCSLLRDADRLSRSEFSFCAEFRIPLSAGLLYGCILARALQPASFTTRHLQTVVFSPCPFWAKPIICVGLSTLTTVQAWIRLPILVQRCWAGFPSRFRVTAVSSRFIRLRVSRTDGEDAVTFTPKGLVLPFGSPTRKLSCHRSLIYAANPPENSGFS